MTTGAPIAGAAVRIAHPAMVEPFAYGAEEIHSIDFVSGPRPHVRVYTQYFLKRGTPLRPLAWGCDR